MSFLDRFLYLFKRMPVAASLETAPQRPRLTPFPEPLQGTAPAGGSAEALERIRQARAEKLSYVDLSGLALYELPPEALELEGVESFFLWGNRFTSVPEELQRVPKLRFLHLDHNYLSRLPAWIFEMPNLLTLSVSGNRIGELPIGRAPSAPLHELDISGNAFEMLTPNIARLKHLKKLSVGGNQGLRWLADRLPALESLNLSNLRLDRLPDLSLVRSLRSLAISDNPLPSLPDWLGGLIHLEHLFAHMTLIKELPEALRSLRRLEILELSGTLLQRLPDWIGDFPALEQLSVSRCGLTSLPEAVGRLWQLRSLSAASNDLQRLPQALRSLPKLETLFLHGNARLGIPDEVLGPPASEVNSGHAQPARASSILAYYYRLWEGISPLNEAKLILVGRGSVGKTSIVNRLVHDRFQRDEGKTDGIQITPWSFRLPPADDIRLHVWDFGGQEIMHATHQFFLTHRSLYLLVLSGRGGGEDADAEYWLKLIQSRGADSSGEESPVIVVLNKIDEHPFQMDRRGLCAKYPGIKAFIETDCETKHGIADLCELIRLETGRLRHLRDPFPASWFAIKDRLAGMKENYLTYERFREICRESGEADEVAQDQLATYLNSLGIALNYRDDPRLRDMHVLNPHWVTEGIYTILNSPLLAAQHGVLHLDQVSSILDERQFPAHMHQFLVNLMRKFELCFPFPDDDGRYLVPELLGKGQPDLGAFDFSESLNFQYDYSILPEGLVSRFIVRTHALSRNLPRWRTGVWLELEGQCAVVIADVQERRVRIAVSGPVAGRRRLLAVIRSNFEHIHSSIEKLKPVEMVPIPGHAGALVPFNKLVALERAGHDAFPEVVNGEIVTLSVRGLLDGVDIGPGATGDLLRSSPMQVYISYSHKDDSLRSELETHLTLLQRVGLLSNWSDRRIDPGDEWRQLLDDRIDSAHVIVLLVSADFLASDYCYGQELNRAMARHASGSARVIPVIVRDVAWNIAPFAKLQVLPRDGQPVTSAPNRDTAWRQVSEGIAAVIQGLRAKRGRATE